jgi:transposase-like protein
VDETYVKVPRRWRYVYRAIDQSGQVIDVYVSTRRDGGAARCFFTRALANTKVIRWRSPPTGRSSIRMFSMS